MILRDYQTKAVQDTESEWAAGALVVLARLDTGAGKTAILAQIINDNPGFIAAIAHRDKLVEQISMTLARAGIVHDLIASEKTKRLIARKHARKLGRCFYVPGARVRVASVDTLKGADDPALVRWLAQVMLWIVDEGHHVLRANKWGRCIDRFTAPGCRGFLLTATPGRPDGKGLGRHADGYVDVMVEGPPMRWLIDQGYLADYDVICPPNDIVIEGTPGASGDYSNAQLRTAARKSHIVGDVATHYTRWAAGKSGITFAPDVETAVEMVAAYRAAGWSAELITGETDIGIRDQVFDRAEAGTLNQIVAVDVVSEGVDIPALLVGSFARPTQSWITWRQQVGRLLRPIYAPGFDLSTRAGRLAAIAAGPKPRAFLIDHCGAFAHPNLGPPDRAIVWSLDRREKRGEQEKDPDDVPQRICTNPDVDCFKPYPAILRTCPFCGYRPEPAGRSSPAQVEGDLELLTPEALAALRGDVVDPMLTRAQHDAQQLAKGARTAWLGKHWESFVETGTAQICLRASMDAWAGQRHAAGWSDSMIQRGFWHAFGVDVLSAMALGAADAIALKERVDTAVNRAHE